MPSTPSTGNGGTPFFSITLTGSIALNTKLTSAEQCVVPNVDGLGGFQTTWSTQDPDLYSFGLGLSMATLTDGHYALDPTGHTPPLAAGEHAMDSKAGSVIQSNAGRSAHLDATLVDVTDATVSVHVVADWRC